VRDGVAETFEFRVDRFEFGCVQAQLLLGFIRTSQLRRGRVFRDVVALDRAFG